MERDDFVEEYEKLQRTIKIATIGATVFSILLNIWVALSLMSDVLGIDLGEVYRQIVKYGWRLPPDWVARYQPYLYTMEWILLVTVIVDTAVSAMYTREGIPEVPIPYLRVVSFISFFCGMWLYFAYKVAAYGIIFFAGLLTFSYTFVVKKESEEGEEEEEFESEIWKEAATVFDPEFS